MFIDCTDGTLARRARVKEVLPHSTARSSTTSSTTSTTCSCRSCSSCRAGLLPRHALGAAGRRRCRCSPAATASASRRRRRPTTSSPASRRTGTSSPSTCSCSAGRTWINAAVLVGVQRDGVRADPLPLSEPHADGAEGRPTSAARSGRSSVFWLLAQFPTPSRALALLSLLYPGVLRGVSFWLHLRTPPSPRHA